MDEFDEDVEIAGENPGSKVGLVAVLIGIVGIVVGMTGIIMANQSQKAVKTLRAQMAAEPDKTPELEEDINGVNERLEKLGSEFVKLGRQDRQLQENMQSAFDSVLRDVKENRDGINEVTVKMVDLVEKLENWKPARTTTVRTLPETSGEESSTDPVEPGPVAEGGIYSVQSGDTMSGIAQRFGVSLSALMGANPTVNPRAMRIGQKIVIPE